MNNFQANCLPLLIGSLPLDDHEQALSLVFKQTPEIPLWIQLPVFKEEGMIEQFLPGIPGLTRTKNKACIDTSVENFEDDLYKFYEEYMAVIEERTDLLSSRFVLANDTAAGFFEFIKQLKQPSERRIALKGQITGPVTFGTSLTDQNKRIIFYSNQLKDVVTKLIALKAKWQVKMLASFGYPVIVFFDEPALAGFGSSAFISISSEEIAACFQEVIAAVHAEGGLAGMHVCANADWSLVLESDADIVSFDAYSYFDKFILYKEQIISFLESGRIIAWGIVPTSNVLDIEKETTDSLIAAMEKRVEVIEEFGIDKSTIFTQALITPSCGTGSLSFKHALKVLNLTKQVSQKLRSSYLL